MENFTKGSLTQNTSGIWRKLGGALLSLAILIAFGTTASAQVFHTETFQAGGTGTWTTAGYFNTTTNTCESTRSVRDNMWSSSTTGNLTSGLLGTSNGLLVTMSFDYKVVDWSAATNPTPANFGTIFVQYGATATGPWTTVHTINSVNHTPSATCATPVVTFTPPAGNLYMKFDCIWNAGDFYLYFDDINVSQATPTCSGAPATPTAAISGTSGCDGVALTLTGTGLDVGTGLSQQWEYSSDNFVGDINDLTGETAAVANITAPATTVYYRLRHECNDVPSIVYSNTVSYAGVSCGTDVVPFSGNDANPCGNSIAFTDHAGAGTNYNSNADGYLVLENTPGSFINLSGTYEMENTWDFIYIYDGVGTGGTLLQTLTGGPASMTPIAGTDGQQFTVQMTSDGSATRPGFNFQAIYSGTCATCSGAPAGGTITADVSGGCGVAPISLAATGLDVSPDINYQWQVSNDNFVADINDIAGAINPTTNQTTPLGAVTTYYRIKSTCTVTSSDAFSNVVSYVGLVCGAHDVPTSGFNTIVCGTNTWLYDDVGGATNYSSGVNAYTVVDASGGAIPSIYGDYDMENTWDFVNVYDGAGTGGTLLGSFTGTGTIDITGTAGTPLTVQLTSDASFTRPGFALQVTYDVTVPCASCTAPPAAGTVSIPSTGGCSGGTMTLTTSGLDVTGDNTYQWQVSNDDFVADINDIAGETGTTYDLTTVDGTFYYRIKSFCSADLLQPSFSPSVSFAGFACASASTPVTGSNSVTCGVTTLLTDDGGPGSNYSNGSDGYTVFESSLTAQISFSGTYDTENTWDFVRIYEGVGTGGTLAYSYTGAGTITPFISLPGQAITIQMDADASFNDVGFEILGVYSGTCDPCAAAPTVTASTLVTNNSASINWTAAAVVPGVGYEWEVRTSGAGGSGATGLVATGTTNNSTFTVALGAILTGNTAYTVHVRSECTAATDYSSWNTGGGDFTTPCDPETAPTVEENFDTYTGNAPNPVCWAEANNVGVPTTPTAVAEGNGAWGATTGFGNTGSDAGAKINLWGTTDDDWIISQPIDLGLVPNTYRVSFNMVVTSFNGTTVQSTLGAHEVYLIMSTDGGATWDDDNILHTFTGPGSYGIQEFAIDLTTQTGEARFAIVANEGGTSPDVDFHIDDFVVEIIPTCFEPGVTAATAVTNNAASINWTAAALPTPTNYEWEVRTSGAGGSGATGLVASGTTVDGSTLTAAVSGLSEQTTYFVYVRSFCGGSDYSGWNDGGNVEFTTECDPVTAPTVNQGMNGFTNGSSEPLTCWKEANGAIGTPSVLTVGNADWSATSGFGNAGSNPAVKDNLWGADAGAWLISPAIDLGVTANVYRVSYRMKVTPFGASSTAATMGTHQMNVMISLDGGVTWNAADVLASYTGAGTYDETTYTHNLTTQTGIIKVAFVNTEGGTSPDIDIHIDDFIVEVIPPCVAPTAAAAEDVTDATATINWVEPGDLPGIGYEFEVRSSGAGGSGATGLDASGSEAVGTDFNAVTGLTPNTTYTVYVRSYCSTGPDIYSTWGTIATFTTLCTPETAPTVPEDFDTYSGAAPDPVCWSEAQGGIATPSVLTSTTSAWVSSTRFVEDAADASARVNLWAFGATTAWLVSQPVDLGLTPGDYRVAFNMGATTFGGTTAVSDLGSHVVDVIVSQDAGATWNAADVIATYTGAGTYDGSNVTIDLTTYSGVVKVAFVAQYNTTSPDLYFYVDDFEIEEIPTCFEPTALTAANIQIDGADVSWTAPTLGTVTGYEYEISTSATPPATGTAVAGTSVTGITGLASGTLYYLHVRTACIAPGDFSGWETTTFTTTYENPFCNPAGVAIPDDGCSTTYLEQEIFVSGHTDLLGTDLIVNKCAINIQHTWDADLRIILVSPAGTEVMLSEFNGGSANNYGGDGCNVTPTVFSMDATTAITAGSAPFQGNYIPEGDFADFDGEDPNGLWTLKICDDAGFDTGELQYFRLQIVPPPTCFAPINLASSGYTPTAATVTWDAGTGSPGPSSYQFYWNTTGVAPTELTTPTGPATGLSIFLNTLSPGTHYYIWVRSDCGIQQSDWSDVHEFDTTLPNDACSGATPIACGGSYNDDSSVATSEVVPGQVGSTGPGLWYSFIGTGGDVTFSTCATGLTFDSEINVLTGTCGTFTSVGNNDDNCGGGGNFGSGVTVATTAGTEYFVYVSSYASFEPGGAFTLDVSCGGFWTGAIDSDWATAGNWSSGVVPGSGDNAVIPSAPSGGNFPDVAGGAPVNNLIVQSGANIDIADGASVTVEGDLTLDGIINVANDGSLVQETGSGLSGTGYVNVTKDGSTTGYDYWSSPVINGGLGAYFGFNSANSTIDPSDDDNDPGWFEASGAIPGSKGGAFYAAGPGRVFTGVPHNGDQPIAVTDNAAPADDWDLLGNPYPSGVDILSWVLANSGVITGGMSFWDGTSYATHNGVSGNNFNTTGANSTESNGILGTCQGFMANALAGGGTVQFTNAMRVADNSDVLYRLSQLQELKVSAVSAMHGPNQTTVGFFDSSADGVDVFDSPKLGILDDISLFSYIAGSEYAINFHAPLTSAVEIPLGVNSSDATNITFTLDEFTDMDNEFIYLEDRVDGVFTDLKQGDYVFPASAQLYSSRFYLHVSSSAVTGIEDELSAGMNAFVADEMLNIFSMTDINGDIDILDMSGKVVMTKSNMTVGPNGIQLSLKSFSDGVYIVRVVGEDVNMSQKILK